MDAQEVLANFQKSDTVTPEIEAAISEPAIRRELYKLLVSQPAQPFAALIRAAFRKEREFREALWVRTVDDDDDFYEGIYHCAFLIYRVGDVADLEYLWTTKHINMDVGTCLGAEYFCGPGVEKALEYLRKDGADEIADYLNHWNKFGWSEEDRKGWEEYMVEYIRES